MEAPQNVEFCEVTATKHNNQSNEKQHQKNDEKHKRNHNQPLVIVVSTSMDGGMTPTDGLDPPPPVQEVILFG